MDSSCACIVYTYTTYIIRGYMHSTRWEEVCGSILAEPNTRLILNPKLLTAKVEVRNLCGMHPIAMVHIIYWRNNGEDRELPWQGSTPEFSSIELPSQGASPDVLSVSKVGAISTPVCSCDKSPGSSIGKSISSYSSF